MDPARGGSSSSRAADGDCGRLSLLGAFAFTVNASSLRVPLAAQRVLAFLGLNSPVERQIIAGNLWPDVTNARATASLRTVLSKVQHACSSPVIVNAGTYLSLTPWVLTDTRELREIATDVISGSRSASEAALGLLAFRGELLPAWDDEWLILEREELRQIYLQALESCAARLLQAGYCASALLIAYKAIRVDPFRESARRQLIEIHLAQGNRLQAVDAYRTFTQQLWQDHRIRPSSILENLIQLATPAPPRPAT